MKIFNLIIIFLICLYSNKVLLQPINLTYKQLQRLQPKLSDTVAKEYLYLINKYCINIEPELVISIFYVESSLLFYRTNNEQDIGLGQINILVWGDIYKVNKLELLNPIRNIEVSCNILNKLKKLRPKNKEYYLYYHNSNKKLQKKYKMLINSAMNTLTKY